MAVTYKKKLKSITVYQMPDGAAVPITITDTTDDDKATRILNEYKNYGTAELLVGDSMMFVPYHAVQYIKITEELADVTKADPYCGE